MANVKIHPDHTLPLVFIDLGSVQILCQQNVGNFKPPPPPPPPLRSSSAKVSKGANSPQSYISLPNIPHPLPFHYLWSFEILKKNNINQIMENLVSTLVWNDHTRCLCQYSTKPPLSTPPSAKVRNYPNPLPPTLADVTCERSHIGWPIHFHDTDNTNSYLARYSDHVRPHSFIKLRGIAMIYLE